jgi:hypothetical protein
MMFKTILQRSVVITVSLTIAIFIGCYSNGTDELPGLGQGVVGIVWLKPGFDGEDAQNYSDPPDLTPRPLAGATVYLIKYKIGDPKSLDIIATTHSDSLGRFELTARPGTYYLAGSTTAPRTAVRSITPGDPVGMDLQINTVSVVIIRPGKFTEQSLEIVEEVLQ